MDVLYRKGVATAQEVMDTIHDPPSYSAVRAALATLEAKGHVRHEKDGPRYVFIPTTSVETAKRSAVRHLIETFFRGSREQAVAALLDVSPGQFSEDELNRLADLINQKRKRGKR
jgi:predicted transcriptional regulator